MTIVTGLLILSFLVFFHELGHFLLARLCGVEVEAFSIFMGPVLLHKKIGKTDYRLSLLPIGGYCQMKGEKDFSKAVEDGLGYVPGGKDSLFGTHPLKRALIGFAGPFFNLFFAFAASTIIATLGYTYVTRSATIQIPDDPAFKSPAREAGIKSGDTIVKIAGKEIADFSDIYEQVALRGDEDVEVEVSRPTDLGGQERLVFTVHTLLNKKEGNGILGVMASGDTIQKEVKALSFFPALKKGFLETGKLLGQTLKSIGILFKGVDITNAVSGPARISSMLGESAKEGFSAGMKTGWIVLLQFMALISVSLFIMNLLPIPILDGGLILFALIQTVTKRQIPPRIQYKIQVAGVAVILLLFLVGVGGDIKYFINKIGGVKL
ncbi:MAG: site-2 protease family protein [Treponema sp.]|nr:site-2 protease family protein [Treponema sp.]